MTSGRCRHGQEQAFGLRMRHLEPRGETTFCAVSWSKQVEAWSARPCRSRTRMPSLTPAVRPNPSRQTVARRRFRCERSLLYSCSVPWVKYSDPHELEVPNVARCNRHASGVSNRSNLAIGLRNRTPNGTARHDGLRAGACHVSVKWQYSSCNTLSSARSQACARPSPESASGSDADAG